MVHGEASKTRYGCPKNTLQGHAWYVRTGFITSRWPYRDNFRQKYCQKSCLHGGEGRYGFVTGTALPHHYHELPQGWCKIPGILESWQVCECGNRHSSHWRRALSVPHGAHVSSGESSVSTVYYTPITDCFKGKLEEKPEKENDKETVENNYFEHV